MGLRPLHDWIIVEPEDGKDESSGGILIPDSAQEQPKQGKILAIGDGRDQEEKDEKNRKLKYGEKPKKTFVKTSLKPGQTIIYDQWAGQKVEIDGKDLVMVKEDEVLGTVK